MTRDELYDWLDDRLAYPGRAPEIDDVIWRLTGAERAVLVTDLAGFTQAGLDGKILDFLSTVRAAIRAARPVLRHHEVRFWRSVGDSIIASFAGPHSAIDAAIELRDAWTGEVGISFGIGFGNVLELDDDVFGEEVNIAYKLGEDIAKPGEILLTQAAGESVNVKLEGPLRINVGAVDLSYYRVSS